MMPVGPLEKKVKALVGWARSAVRDGAPVKRDPVRARAHRARGRPSSRWRACSSAA